MKKNMKEIDLSTSKYFGDMLHIDGKVIERHYSTVMLYHDVNITVFKILFSNKRIKEI